MSCHTNRVEQEGIERVPQAEVDDRNAQFWDELCGSGLARSLGITENTPESLQKFDDAYMGMYPYLQSYVIDEDLIGRRVLEIGLGYGTLGQLIASRGCLYHGLDIAPGPVAMMRYRLRLLGQDPGDRARQGSALEIPYPEASFDYVYSIGCLHHTGNLRKAVAEVHRVLVPGGKAVVMLYHRHSLRQCVQIPIRYLRDTLSRRRRYASFGETVRAYYDTNAQGEAAPHTDFVSRAQVRKSLFKQFSRVRIDSQNFDTYVLFRGRIVIPRERLLKNLGRVLGTDLYIVATK
jgi:SAM-dependent methyltransferase